MDYRYLPERIRKGLENLIPGDKKPIAVLRSSGSLDGKSGEGYVVAYDDQILMFSKAFGESDYTKFAGFYDGDLSELYVVNEKFNSFLNVKLADREYTIKLSSFEVKDCEPIIKIWKEICDKKNQPVPPPIPHEASPGKEGEDENFNPMTGMVALLLFIAATDNEIVASEEEYIKKICYGDMKYIEDGQKYYNDHSFEEVLEKLANLDHQQKLCILANMLEVAMSDGAFQSDQQKMINQFMTKMSVSEEDFNTVRDVLLIKNQISALVS